MTPEALREQRLQLGLSQAALAQALGVARNTVARWERSKLEIRHPELIQMALDRLKGGPEQSVGAPTKGALAAAHNLPREVTSFIGREQEIEAVARLVVTTPVLTLSGPGGCGKTRLALQVARRLVNNFADGVCLVELASLNHGQLVPRVVASALGVRDRPGWPLLRSIQEALRPRQLLLVLDNCEHLLGECAALVDGVLESTTDVRVLTTSREPLRVAGEVTWTPAPLSLPSRVSIVARDQLERFEATRLFVERARARLPEFVPTESDSAAIAAICQRLDGMPLAIELAAARITVMSCTQLASRLDNALPLLIAGHRTAPARQQTLRNTLDWSHDLLSSAEQAALRRLAVFAGGWTLEAAEAICGDDSSVDSDSTVVDVLGRLVDKSLVVREVVAGAPRFRLLEPIRQYALERLVERGELESSRRRHLDWCAAFSRRGSPMTIDPPAPLAVELDNIRAALRWSIDAGEIDAGIRIGAALCLFWHSHGYYAEGSEWLSELFARKQVSEPAPAHVWALTGAGLLATALGHYAEAEARLADSLRLAEALGLPKLIGGACSFSGMLAYTRGDAVRARVWYERALAIHRPASREAIKLLRLGKIPLASNQQIFEVDDHGAFEPVRLEAHQLILLGQVDLVDGDVDRASAHGQEALRLARLTRDTWAISQALQVLGRAAHDQGRLAQAQALLNESVKLCQAMDNRPGITYGLTELGTIALDRGNRAGARKHFVQALEVAEKAGAFPHIPRVLEELGSASATSEPSRAAGLAGAAFGLRRGMQAPIRDARLSPADRARLERWIQVARDALGEPAYTRAWQAGTEWPLQVAIHEAVAVEASAPAVSALNGLTPREREVAALVAEGRTNQQIADQLIFTEATARKHVEHILDKLGFSSRAQIVAWHLTVMHATVEIVSGLDVRPTSPSPAPTRQT